MRISLVAAHFAELASRLALGLAENHEVQLHLSAANAMRELTPALRARVESRVETHFRPHPRRAAMLWHGARLAAEIARFRPDVVHAQEAAGWTLGVAALLLRPFGRPSVLTVHDPAPHAGADGRARARTAWADRRLRDHADAIIVHGAWLVATMTRAHPGLAGRVHVVNHGVLGDREAMPRDADARSFLFFGRIEQYKGLGVLLDAAELLASDGVDFRLTVVGAGADLDRHRGRLAAARYAKLDERFAPACEVAGIFARAGAVALPYLESTQSGVAALAFGAGKPIVATAVGSIPEIVRDGVNGLIVAPGDAVALARAMRRVLDEPGLRARLGLGAAETGAGPLSWTSIAAATVRVYEDAATRRRDSARKRKSQ